MQKLKNRNGLALGASFALVASLLTVPSAFASETAVVVSPSGGTAAQDSMIHTEPFELFVRYGSSVVNTSTNFSYRYSLSSESARVAFDTATNPNGVWTAYDSNVTSVSATVGEIRDVSSGSAYVRFRLTNYTSVSAPVSIVVTPYVNRDSDAGLTAGDLQGTPYTINFVPWSSLGATLTHATPVAHETTNTASVTVTAGTINWTQLNGQFSVYMLDSTTSAAGTYSAIATGTTFRISGAQLEADNYSFSARVTTTQLTTSPVVGSVSATLVYASTTSEIANAGAGALSGTSRHLVPVSTLAVASRTITTITLSPVAGANISRSGALTADARINSTFTLQAFGATASSITTSMASTRVVTVSAIAGDMEFDADSGVILNGVTYTSSARFAAAGFTLTGTTNTFEVTTFGQASNGSNDNFTLAVSSQALSTTLQVFLKTPNLVPIYTPTAVAGLAGQTLSFTLTVRDQWNQAPVRTDLRIKAVMSLASSTSEAFSSTVSNGTATVALSPLPATRTGSGTVTFTLQTFNQGTQLFDDGNTDSATWNVFSYAAGTEAFTSRTATASMSVSYGVAGYSWSGVVSVGVANSFSTIAVSAPGLVIENNDQTSITGSGTLDVSANGQTANLRFAGTKPGTYTVTFTQGTASTTSTITISSAGSDRGASFTFSDVSTITAGKTRVLVGTLLDANGNPVDTTLPGTAAGDSGTASIAITAVGTAGIVASTLPLETDANGQFRLSILTAAADNGSLVINATYFRGSTATATFTTTQQLTIQPAPAPEVNAVIGSFNGRWAVRVENAKGSVVSVKAGNRWVKFSALNNNYLFSRKSVVGRTIAVSVWVDGELQNSQTITIK